MTATVACVLRSGGEYTQRDVQWLWNSVRANLRGVKFFCLSDTPVPSPRVDLRYKWPGWWSKMELFRPDLPPGDLLYLDLDTVVTGTLLHLAGARELTMLSDFYHLARPASGLMLIPHSERAAIWEAWMRDPAGIMKVCQAFDVNGVRGDGKFLGELVGGRAKRWQDLFPGEVVSYKVHVRKAKIPPREVGTGSVPPGANVVCFHGKPRPSELAERWIKEARLDWSGETIFLIGGGPSAGQIDLERLRGRGRVIAINDSAKKLPWADAVFTIDDSWVSRRADFLRTFAGRKIFAVQPGFRLPPGVDGELLERIDAGGALSNDPMRIVMGFNSGFGAINLAASRGAKRIVLIGYDMDQTNPQTHWHGGYEWKCRFGRNDYPDWAAGISNLAPALARMKVDVVNLNPQSAIKAFRFATLDQVLN